MKEVAFLTAAALVLSAGPAIAQGQGQGSPPSGVPGAGPGAGMGAPGGGRGATISSSMPAN